MKIVDPRDGSARNTDAPDDEITRNARVLREHRKLLEKEQVVDHLTSNVRAALGTTGPGSGRHAKAGRRGGRHRAD